MLTVGSLFSGVGGLELGLERAGMRVVWQVEQDDYARKVLWQHWPLVPKYEDVRTVGAANLAPVDLICGGFPCQDISYAGKGVGLAGERSGLWSEFARIIRELRPRYVVVENVPALLSRGMGRVLGDLAASGYDAEWDCIPASAVGAPHRRDRVFLVAHSDDSGLEGWNGAVMRECPGKRTARSSGASMADAGQLCARRSAERQQAQSRWTFGEPTRSSWWDVEPAVGRVADGISNRVDQLRCLGNSIVPQVAEHIGRLILRADAEAI